jgi:hypothetical protein
VTELTPEKLFLAMLMMGVVMAVLFILLSAATEAVKSALLWVDDRKSSGPWPMAQLIAKAMGYKESSHSYKFEKEGKEDQSSSDILGKAAVVVGCIPMVVCLTIKFYPIVLSLALLYAIAHTARFARRHKKLFDQHVKDPGAHEK